MVWVGGVGVSGRLLTPLEKMLLHVFPIHNMSIPDDFPYKQLGYMGGNTMHLKSVALALLIGAR